MRAKLIAGSIVTRIVASYCLGGLLLLAVLSGIYYQNALEETSVRLAEHVADEMHNVLHLGSMLEGPEREVLLDEVLKHATHTPGVVAIRLTDAQMTLSQGEWGTHASTALRIDMQDLVRSHHAELNQTTVAYASVPVASGAMTVEVLVDGPWHKQEAWLATIQQGSQVLLVIGLLTLIGLVLLRRWLTRPLMMLTYDVARSAEASTFAQTAEDMNGEFKTLTLAIAHMLSDIDRMSGEISTRQRAFEDLFEFAPGALLTIGPDGIVRCANHKAAELMGVDHPGTLVGTQVLESIHKTDRGAFRQIIERLQIARLTDTEVKLHDAAKAREVKVQLAGVFNEHDTLSEVRLALVDVSESKRMLKHLSDQQTLMNLVIDHMSDAILLVGVDGQVLMANARLQRITGVSQDDLVQHPYDPAGLWAPLDLRDADTFGQRVRAVLGEPSQPWQEQFTTQGGGAFEFQAVPVTDNTGVVRAQLWVVEDATSEIRHRNLLSQQNSQLRALNQLGRQLCDMSDLESLLNRVMQDLNGILELESMGIAVRYADPERRCKQLIYEDDDKCTLSSKSSIAEVVPRSLMPEVFEGQRTCHWTDLQQAGDWGPTFEQAGYTSVASTAMISREGTQGILWIARRGGKPIEQHHLYLLEALAPMVSTALQITELRVQMEELALSDPLTGLPSFKHFEMRAEEFAETGERWACLLIDVDRFQLIHKQYGLSVSNDALYEIAMLLHKHCRRSDQVFRHSEDKFLVACRVGEDGIAEHHAERLREQIELARLNTRRTNDPFALTCSIGVAYCDQADDYHGMLKLAEQRLAVAKSNGRNRIESADPQTESAA